MPPKQSLNAVAHDLVEHARHDSSGLESLVAEAAREARTWSATLDLRSDSPFLPDFPVSGPLRRAASRLAKIFAKRLANSRLDADHLHRARLQFVFSPGGDAKQGRVRCELVTLDGREYGHTLEPDAGGNTGGGPASGDSP